MKVKDIIKKQTTLIALAVVLVAVAVSGISYAIFFDISTNDKTQVITAGTLQVSLSDITALTLTEPLSEGEGKTGPGISYTVRNTGSLPATYRMYIYANPSTTNPLSIDKIKISTDGTTVKTFSTLTKATINGNTECYLVDSGDVTTTTPSPTKTIKVWLDDGTVTEADDGKNIDLKIYIVSEVKE